MDDLCFPAIFASAIILAVSGDTCANQRPPLPQTARTSLSHSFTTSKRAGILRRKVVACFPNLVFTPSLGHCLTVRVSRSTADKGRVTNAPIRIPERNQKQAEAFILRSANVLPGALAIASISSSVTASCSLCSIVILGGFKVSSHACVMDPYPRLCFGNHRKNE